MTSPKTSAITNVGAMRHNGTQNQLIIQCSVCVWYV